VIDSDISNRCAETGNSIVSKCQSLPRGTTLSTETQKPDSHISKIILPIITSGEIHTHTQSSHVVISSHDDHDDGDEFPRRSLSLSLIDLLKFSETTV